MSKGKSAQDVIITLIMKSPHVFLVTTLSETKRRLRYNSTTAKAGLDLCGAWSKPLFVDADSANSIKAHLRACERCYYGDKK